VGVDPPTFEAGQLVWKAKSLPAHSIRGPFEFHVLTARLGGRPTLTATARADFAHAWAPVFRGYALSPEVAVQVSNR